MVQLVRPNLGWSTSSNPWLGDSAPTTTHGTPSLWSTIVTDFRAFFFPFFFFPSFLNNSWRRGGESRPRRRQIGKMTVTQSDRRQPPTVSQSMCLPSGAEDGTGVDLPFNGIAAGRDFRFCYLAKRAECPDSLLGRVHVQPSSGIMLSTPITRPTRPCRMHFWLWSPGSISKEHVWRFRRVCMSSRQ